MLCNNCGKVLEGKATLCSECAVLGNVQPGRTASSAEIPRPKADETGAESSSSNASDNPDAIAQVPFDPMTLAPRLHRAAAALIDGFVLALVVRIFEFVGLQLLIGGFVNSALGSLRLDNSPIVFFLPLILGVLLIIVYLVLTPFINSAYFILFESAAVQATPGKILVGIYVATAEGTRPALKMVVVRFLGKCLWKLPLLVLVGAAMIAAYLATTSVGNIAPGSLWLLGILAVVITSAVLWYKTYLRIAIDPNRRGLHDILAGTVVFSRENRLSDQRVVGVLLLSIVCWALLLATRSSSSEPMTPRTLTHSFSSGVETKSNKVLKDEPFDAGPGFTGPSKEELAKLGFQLKEERSSSSSAAVEKSLEASDVWQMPAPEATVVPTEAPAIPTPEPTVVPNAEVVSAVVEEERVDNLVSFGAVKRYFPFSVGFFNAKRTELRLYLGQNEFSYDQLDVLARHDPRVGASATGADIALVVEYPERVGTECGLSRAKQVTMLVYRRGIAGFPLPGSLSSLRVIPNPEQLAKVELKCEISPSGRAAVSGILRGSGVYSQGQAEYPLTWNVKVAAEID